MGKKAAVMWSGGKDCNLALELALENGYEIVVLLTFHSADTAFRAHATELMQLQSRSLNIPHLMVAIEEPFAENYERQLLQIKEQLHLEVLVSGDISEIHGNTNWISERAKAVGLETFLPLWQLERQVVLNTLINRKFEVVLTMVKRPWLTAEFVGRQMDVELISVFETIENLDLCGEQGEYHTMVLNGPSYRTPINIRHYDVTTYQDMMYMDHIDAGLNSEYAVPALEKFKRCVQCRAPFSCYTQGCWCADLPMIMPLEKSMDCLCPNCLKSAINEKWLESGKEPLI